MVDPRSTTPSRGISRRGFLGATLAATLPWPQSVWAGLPSGFAVKLGYASITWGGPQGESSEQAIEDVSAVGFKGIQLRSSVIPKYPDNPEALKKLLDAKGLELSCFSSGQIQDAPEARHDELMETHLKNARFVQALGGHYMQITSGRNKDKAPGPADFERAGRFLNELGRRTTEIGVRVAYHNHMGALSEHPEELEQLMEATEPRFVDLLLDIAHYKQGGGDPVAAVPKYRHRLAVLHLKDVRPVAPEASGGKTYQFCELGRGTVDVPGVIDALKKIEFRGPAVIELDAVPDKDKDTPKSCAETNKKYVTEKLGLKL
jgi:inosose dehydratase